MYCSLFRISDACSMFDEMPDRNSVSWNALILGLAMKGRGEMEFEAFDSMRKENFKPDSVTFLALLGACCHQGFVEDGRSYFIAMERDFSLQPKIEHHGSMVDLLGRARLLDEAHELIKTMPMKGLRADAVIWRALLIACRIWDPIFCNEALVEDLFGEFSVIYDIVLNNSLERLLLDKPETMLHLIKGIAFRSARNDYGASSFQQIYLTFLTESTLTGGDYFNQFGLVRDVRNPQQEKNMFGSVSFYHRQTTHVVWTLDYLISKLMRSGMAITSSDVSAFGGFTLEDKYHRIFITISLSIMHLNGVELF